MEHFHDLVRFVVFQGFYYKSFVFLLETVVSMSVSFFTDTSPYNVAYMIQRRNSYKLMYACPYFDKCTCICVVPSILN